MYFSWESKCLFTCFQKKWGKKMHRKRKIEEEDLPGKVPQHLAMQLSRMPRRQVCEFGLPVIHNWYGDGLVIWMVEMVMVIWMVKMVMVMSTLLSIRVSSFTALKSLYWIGPLQHLYIYQNIITINCQLQRLQIIEHSQFLKTFKSQHVRAFKSDKNHHSLAWSMIILIISNNHFII